MRDEGVAYHITGLSEPRLIGSGPPESGRSIGVGAPVGVNGGRLECFQCARGRTATGLARIAGGTCSAHGGPRLRGPGGG